MKILKYLFAVAALGFATLSCEVISEDAFSTLPVPPEMYAHSNILMTSNTMDEYVNFSWKPARFLSEGVNYNLYAKYGNTSSVSIPLTIVSELQGKLSDARLLLSGFGVGMTWGSCIINSNGCQISELVEY